MKDKQKFMKKCAVLAVILLIVGGILLAVSLLSPKKNYGSLFHATLGSVEQMACSSDGKIAMNDSGTVLYVLDTDSEEIEYILDANDFGYGKNTSIGEMTFDEAGNLYVQIVTINEEAYLTDLEMVVCIDMEGKIVREVYRHDYAKDINAPKRSGRIHGLHAENQKLSFIYDDQNMTEKSVARIDIDLVSDITEQTPIVLNDYLSVCEADYYETDSYLLKLADGSIAQVTADGKLSIVYECQYDNAGEKDGQLSMKQDDGQLPEVLFTDLAVMGERIFGIGNNQRSVYELVDGKVVYQSSVEDYYDLEGYSDADLFSYYFVTLAASSDTTYVSFGDEIFTLDGSTSYQTFELPFVNIYASFISNVLWIIASVLLLAGAILGIGTMMGWRFTLLSKQLFMLIPVIVIMISVMIITMTVKISEWANDMVNREMVTISELTVPMLDGDALSELNTVEAVRDGRVAELHQLLLTLSGNNQNIWNKMLEFELLKAEEDGTLLKVASNYDYDVPFYEVMVVPEEEYLEAIEEDWQGEADTYISVMYTQANEYATALTAIRGSDGHIVGYLSLSSDMQSVLKTIRAIQKKVILRAIICMLIIIVAIVFITLYIVKNLRKASAAVNGIASGDFSVRVGTTSKDEIGEICQNVDTMAGQLETLFREKDKNEQFYYKFVPEKFRELLHKDKFTDLSLGDAESADLTVLFCDIRSFSLNSEMMTAKENFEFVNVIYGIAGPIIRKHGGFVDKYIGDAVMALFEHADDAVEAGIELYKEIALSEETAKRLGVSSINIGIGIHSGMARVGIVGEDERMSGTVISNTVNISSRLESLTKQYQTAMIITKETLDRLSDPDSLGTRYLGMIQVAGVNEVKALYEVLDCLDEERCKERTKTNKDFREAVRLFHLGQLEESLKLFQKVKKESKKDPVIDKYIAIIEEKLKKGDTSHNVFRFDKK